MSGWGTQPAGRGEIDRSEMRRGGTPLPFPEVEEALSTSASRTVGGQVVEDRELFPPGGGVALFQDTGCDVAPECLKCPEPTCRYDVNRRPGNRSRGTE